MIYRCLFVFLAFVLLAQPAFGSGEGGVPRITPMELNSMLQSGKDILILDVRGGLSLERDLTVIKAAVRKPVAEIYRGEGLPVDMEQEIVLYCT